MYHGFLFNAKSSCKYLLQIQGLVRHLKSALSCYLFFNTTIM